MTPREALEKAIDQLGGQTEAARRITEEMRLFQPDCAEVKQQHVWAWIYRNQADLDARYVLPIEAALAKITDRPEGWIEIRRHRLRPDIYPAEKAA